MASKYGDLESKIDSLKANGKPIEENGSFNIEIDGLFICIFVKINLNLGWSNNHGKSTILAKRLVDWRNEL